MAIQCENRLILTQMLPGPNLLYFLGLKVIMQHLLGVNFFSKIVKYDTQGYFVHIMNHAQGPGPWPGLTHIISTLGPAYSEFG